MKSPSSFKLLQLLIFGSGKHLPASVFMLYFVKEPKQQGFICAFPVWPAWLPNSGHPQLGKGGSKLDSWQLFDVYASTGWSGKFWGRPNCQFDTVLGTGCCETGDCSNAIGCNSTYSPPATTVEFKLHRDFIDEYSVSLVEGYNLAVKVSSSNPVCLSGGCSCDLNSRCPSELLVWNSRGTPVACNSPCLAFGADEFCCEDEFLGG
ncbi:thaumatin-like protein 1 [Selaginella moellendorffii]|uniref:thaumatin-like protein 1 n=1 Tax=Selaginella moellendorffii TaxID=88036 RepID=UPI000D1CF0BB|nr:thaumatin-like protein 1 [Selaginella moellendorffii]|eukprot:XP_024544451.1 thaumatin-like protein 1 [Selaginella moellendorffii]